MDRRVMALGFASACAGTASPGVAETQAPPAPIAVPGGLPPACPPLAEDDPWLATLLERHADALGPVLTDPEAHRLQMVVGEVRGEGNDRCIHWHPYRHQAEYFYPASTLKPLVAVAALASLRQAAEDQPALAGVGLDTPLQVQGRAGVADPRISTLRTEIRASLFDSSNSAFNFTWNLAGQARLHRILWDGGLASVSLPHRLQRSGLGEEEQGWAPRVDAVLPAGTQLVFPERPFTEGIPPHGLPGTLLGRGYTPDGSRRVVLEPFDVSRKNSVSLYDMARVTAWLVQPDLVPSLRLPELAAEDRAVVLSAMSETAADWTRSHPFRAGLMETVPGRRLRYVKKNGIAYGFHSEVAWVSDERSGRAFVVGSVVYANPNGILNDGEYGYEDTTQPFFQALGVVLGQELLADRQ